MFSDFQIRLTRIILKFATAAIWEWRLLVTQQDQFAKKFKVTCTATKN